MIYQMSEFESVPSLLGKAFKMSECHTTEKKQI